MVPAMGMAAGTAPVGVSATVLSKNQCRFSVSNITLAFATAIDPSSSTVVTATAAPAGITIRCAGSSATATFSITHDSGLYETGANANRMRHASVLTEYLPYTLTISPSSATVPKNTDFPIAISGNVAPADYQNAYSGSYADTVVLTISP